jgi:hypothetical protein
MEIIAGPAIETRKAQPYLGIGMVTPFRGMLSARDRLWDELFGWLGAHGIDTHGPAFLRLRVIDMRGTMDIEAGVETKTPLRGDARVTSGVFPAGEYATLTYRNHSIQANKALIEWTAGEGREFHRDADPAGDRFACRYELNLTDPRGETRRKAWIVQLNFLLRPQRAASAA